MLQLENYQVKSSYTREESIHGGSIILIRNSLDGFEEVSFIKDLSIECEIEISCIVSRTRKLVVLNIYRTCLGSVHIFLETLEQVLNEINSKFKDHTVIICGDFNINLMSNDNSKISFIDLLITFNYKQTILSPTRITNNTSSLIDNIFVNTNNFKHNGNITSALSDHMSQFIAVETDIPIKTNIDIKSKRRFFTEIKLEDFFCCLRECAWDGVLSESDSDRAYELLSATMRAKMDQIFPYKKCRQKSCSNVGWMTMGIRISSNHKRELYKKR